MKIQKSRLLYLVLVVLILSFSSVAFGISFDQETSGQWTKFGFDRYSSNSYVYPVSVFNVGLTNGSNFTYTDNIVAGGNFQPIAFDWDSDGVVEVIAPSGTDLKIYNPSTNSLVEEATYSMGGTMGVQSFCGSDDVLGKYCVINVGNNLVTLSYDGSSVSSLGSALSSYSVSSAINCYSDSAEGYDLYCYAEGYNVTDDKQYLIQYKANTDDNINYFDIGSNATYIKEDFDSGVNYYNKRQKPVISDIDYDGNIEIVYAGLFGAQERVSIQVAEWNATSNVVSKETSFNSVGYVFSTADTTIGYVGFIVYDVDGATDEEICFKFYRTGGSKNYLRCLNSDGTFWDTFDTLPDSERNIGLTLADIDNDNTMELVDVYVLNGGTSVAVAGYEVSGGAFSQISKTTIKTGTDYSERYNTPSMALINNDDNYDLLIGNVVAYFNDSGDVYAYSEINTDERHMVPVNFNQDAQMDFIGQELNSLSLYTEGTGGVATSSTITLNTALDNSGFYNYFPTICKGETQTFKALECVAGVFDSTCTYINTDTTATERIASYGAGGSLKNGAYDSLNPEIDIDFNNTGIYTIRLYMQDTSTSSYYGVYEDIQISVVDGTSGSDCNIATEFVTQPSSQTSTITTPTELNDVEDFFELFSGGSSLWKFIFGIVIILGMVTMAYGTFKSVFMAIIFGIVGLILATILGLIPLWVIIGMALLMALPLLLKFAFGNNG